MCDEIFKNLHSNKLSNFWYILRNALKTVVKPNDFQLLAVRAYNSVHRYTNKRTAIFTRHVYTYNCPGRCIDHLSAMCVYIYCVIYGLHFFISLSPPPLTKPSRNPRPALRGRITWWAPYLLPSEFIYYPPCNANASAKNQNVH